MSTPGRIWGVGVGPGDPDLLTLKAHRIITSADVIAFPAPEDGDSLARSIVAGLLTEGQREIAVRIAMDPHRFPPRDIYRRAARDIGAHVERGRSVAILCEGDPFFYGSFMYLFENLARKWRVEVVPGVSSLTAGAAALQMPLAARNDVVVVIPATLDEADIQARLRSADMVVFIKVGRHLAKVKSILRRAGLLDKASYIERATMTAERRSAVSDLSVETAPYFSMILVHRRGSAL